MDNIMYVLGAAFTAGIGFTAGAHLWCKLVRWNPGATINIHNNTGTEEI